MTDKPFNEDLLSGYLDDQLTPSERAAAESMLRDSDQQELLSELASQSEQMGAVPKFDLGDKFVERLLADNRVETVFESLLGEPASQLKPDSSHSSKRFSAAVAAIASLAALVLITLFVPQIPTPNVEVAGKIDDPTPSGNQLAGEEREAIAPVNELRDSGVADDRPFEMEEKEIDASEDETAPALAQIQLAGKDLKLKPEGFSRDQESKKMMPKLEGAPSNSAPSIEDKLNEKMERAATVRNLGTDDSRNQMGRRLDGAERSRKETSSVGRGRARGEKSKSQDRFFEDAKGGAGGIEMASERKDQLVQNNANRWWSGKDAIQDVFEVNYSGGPEMIDEFQQSLVRNSIELQGDPSLGFRSELEKMKGAIRGVEPAAGLSNRIVGGQQKERQLSEMLVTVTATPQHMADLIKDLNRKASIFNIGKGRSVVTRSAPAPRLGAEGSFEKDAGDRGSEADKNEEEKVESNGTANVMTWENLPAKYFDDGALAKLKEPGQKTANLDPLLFKNEIENQRANYLLIIRTGQVTADMSIESSVAPARQQNK